MIPIFKSLEQISTGYTVFEKDQVLTHEQLNSLADYADDQIRLTRVKLLGAGIACGLYPSVDKGRITITRGAGITTDGDIISLESDVRFTRFRHYNASYPAYPPLYLNVDPNDEKIDVWELLTDDDDAGDLSWPLSDFSTFFGRPITDMLAVALMESYLKDDDICSGTDCDNLGKYALNRQRFVLIAEEWIDQLAADIPTVGDNFTAMNEIIADRAVATSALTSPAAIGSLYRNACNAIMAKLRTEIGRIYPIASQALGNVLQSDPTSAWLAKLQQLQSSFAGSDTGIQYYYDFLKDLAETCNTFRHLLFGDTVQCAQNVAAFPKHLVLGLVSMGLPSDEYRTLFYPSTFAGRSADEREHARFLIRKLDMMIGNFTIAITPASGGTADIRITPSSHEDVSLEERAIPFYYPATSANRLFDYWS